MAQSITDSQSSIRNEIDSYHLSTSSRGTDDVRSEVAGSILTRTSEAEFQPSTAKRETLASDLIGRPRKASNFKRSILHGKGESKPYRDPDSHLVRVFLEGEIDDDGSYIFTETHVRMYWNGHGIPDTETVLLRVKTKFETGDSGKQSEVMVEAYDPENPEVLFESLIEGDGSRFTSADSGLDRFGLAQDEELGAISGGKQQSVVSNPSRRLARLVGSVFSKVARRQSTEKPAKVEVFRPAEVHPYHGIATVPMTEASRDWLEQVRVSRASAQVPDYDEGSLESLPGHAGVREFPQKRTSLSVDGNSRVNEQGDGDSGLTAALSGEL